MEEGRGGLLEEGSGRLLVLVGGGKCRESNDCLERGLGDGLCLRFFLFELFVTSD